MAEQLTLTREEWKSAQLDGEYGYVYIITIRQMYDADGNKVGRPDKHRRPIPPDADITNEPAVIQQMCALVRTPEALARWTAVQTTEETP
jgi:hypothetical protein